MTKSAPRPRSSTYAGEDTQQFISGRYDMWEEVQHLLRTYEPERTSAADKARARRARDDLLWLIRNLDVGQRAPGSHREPEPSSRPWKVSA